MINNSVAIGYFLPKYNFSVENYKGEYVCRVRLPFDVEIDDLCIEQKKAVLEWAKINRQKFYKS